MRILILGARAPACLQWARVFKATGAQVFAADTLAFPLTRFSKSIDQFFQLPSASSDTRAWLDALVKIITQQSIDVLLPTCEEVFFMCRIACLSYNSYAACQW